MKVCKYLKGRVQRGWSQVPFRSSQWQGSDNGHKLFRRRFPLNIGKLCFIVRVTELRHSLRREVVEIFRKDLDVVLGNGV